VPDPLNLKIYQIPPPKAPALAAMGMKAEFLVSGWGKMNSAKLGLAFYSSTW
jgi:hypothetical protein